MSKRISLAFITAALLLSACGASAVGFQDDIYMCDEQPVSLDSLVLVDGRPGEWLTVEETEERVVIIRELAPSEVPFNGPEFPHMTHSMIITMKKKWDGSENASWGINSSGTCDMRRPLGGLNAAHVYLDPDRPPPGPDSTQIHLLATERGCAGGVPSADRVRLVRLVETTTQVQVIVGMVPSNGGVCTGNIRAPLVVDLAEPLGEREVIDDSVYPPRVLDPISD